MQKLKERVKLLQESTKRGGLLRERERGGCHRKAGKSAAIKNPTNIGIAMCTLTLGGDTSCS